ncbi:uncharacterized protein LOC113210096 [Frankliniella occidentalis]|uniref:Uncharacterized protein LOC113210096 n=1 Tax=Frankliniella occidentalis TaxID=133901 RepID=A0A6J1SS96_FRAOC|nr:uncharacterized protein LOC113210096 [Frankliniella occidentalis]
MQTAELVKSMPPPHWTGEISTIAAEAGAVYIDYEEQRTGKEAVQTAEGAKCRPPPHWTRSLSLMAAEAGAVFIDYEQQKTLENVPAPPEAFADRVPGEPGAPASTLPETKDVPEGAVGPTAAPANLETHFSYVPFAEALEADTPKTQEGWLRRLPLVRRWREAREKKYKRKQGRERTASDSCSDAGNDATPIEEAMRLHSIAGVLGVDLGDQDQHYMRASGDQQLAEDQVQGSAAGPAGGWLPPSADAGAQVQIEEAPCAQPVVEEPSRAPMHVSFTSPSVMVGPKAVARHGPLDPERPVQLRSALRSPRTPEGLPPVPGTSSSRRPLKVT